MVGKSRKSGINLIGFGSSLQSSLQNIQNRETSFLNQPPLPNEVVLNLTENSQNNLNNTSNILLDLANENPIDKLSPTTGSNPKILKKTDMTEAEAINSDSVL
jgi:hypothetical protein